MGDSNPDELRCGVCDRRCRSRTELNAHEEAHDREERQPVTTQQPTTELSA